MLSIKVKRVGNHWYPCITHSVGSFIGFCEKIDRYLSKLDSYKFEELTIELNEVGVIFEGENIIYFNEQDIVRYLTTDDDFELRFMVNDHEFYIHSDLYWILEDLYNFNFHKNSYKISIY